MLIALDAEAMLLGNGVSRVQIASSANEAFVILASFSPAAAMLDVNLASGTSFGVAGALRDRGIPFLFTTGYGDAGMLPADLKSAVIVNKPYDEKTLLDGLAALILHGAAPDASS